MKNLERSTSKDTICKILHEVDTTSIEELIKILNMDGFSAFLLIPLVIWGPITPKTNERKDKKGKNEKVNIFTIYQSLVQKLEMLRVIARLFCVDKETEKVNYPELFNFNATDYETEKIREFEALVDSAPPEIAALMKRENETIAATAYRQYIEVKKCVDFLNKEIDDFKEPWPSIIYRLLANDGTWEEIARDYNYANRRHIGYIRDRANKILTAKYTAYIASNVEIEDLNI